MCDTLHRKVYVDDNDLKSAALNVFEYIASSVFWQDLNAKMDVRIPEHGAQLIDNST